jgi:metallo-beta-lactamase class B
VVYGDSLTAVSAPDFKFAAHPDLLKGFEKSFAFFEKIPCDILITTHPEIADLWSRLERRRLGAKPDPIVDGSACQNLAGNSRKQLEKRLQSEAGQ